MTVHIIELFENITASVGVGTGKSQLKLNKRMKRFIKMVMKSASINEK